MSSVLYAVGPMECTGTGWPWILMPLCTDGSRSKYSHETMGRCRCRCSQMATQHHSTVAVSRARAMCRPWAVPIDGALSRARVVSRAGAPSKAGTVSRPGPLSRAGAVSRAWATGLLQWCYPRGPAPTIKQCTVHYNRAASGEEQCGAYYGALCANYVRPAAALNVGNFISWPDGGGG